MERSALGSVLFMVLVASTALTGQPSFAEMPECKASPGPAAAHGMHWYYRVDRTNNRHCWYLQPAGMQVRSHEIILLSKPRPQVVAGQPLAPSQEDNLQTSPSQPTEAPDGAPLASHFTARWPDLPESVDLSAHDFPRQRDYAAEHPSPHSEQLILYTPFVAPDTISQWPHKSGNAVKFGSVFIAGAISVILCGSLLKLTRVFTSSLTKPRLKRDFDDSSEISLRELMRALRRVDESLKTTEPRRYSPLKARELAADERAQRDNLDRLADYPARRIIRDRETSRRVLL